MSSRHTGSRGAYGADVRGCGRRTWEGEKEKVKSAKVQEAKGQEANSKSAKGKWSARVIYKFTVDDMKAELAKGNLLLAPCDGRTSATAITISPARHTIIWCSKATTTVRAAITNDGGTKHGKDFRYKYAVAYKRDTRLEREQGDDTGRRKALIVIEKVKPSPSDFFSQRAISESEPLGWLYLTNRQ